MNKLFSTLATFFLGVFISAGITWSLLKGNLSDSEVASTQCSEELESSKAQVSMLQSNLTLMRQSLEARMTPQAKVESKVSEIPSVKKDAGQNPKETKTTDTDDDSEKVYIDWRINAIDKVVSLTPQQKDRLRKRFETESTIAKQDVPRDEKQEAISKLESIDDIIGEENANNYKQHVKAAFMKAEQDGIEKEVVWISRKLGLSTEQEGQVRSVYFGIEEEINAKRSANPPAQNPKERMRRMIEENDARDTMLREGLKPILNEQQFNQFVKDEADSSSADVGMFHSGG